MNIKIVGNRYFNSLLVLMLFSASVHMAILVFLAATSGNFYLLNYFKIMDIAAFFPFGFDNPTGNIFSLLVALGLYLFIFIKNKVK